MTLTIQALTMLHMIGAGVYLGMMWDTCTRLRWKSSKRLQVMIEDILFWSISGLVVFVWLKSVNEGNMRIYVLFSLLCGYAFYQALIKAWYIKVLDTLVRILSSIFHFIKRLLTVLLVKPISWLIQTVAAILLFCLGIVGNVLKSSFLLLKRIVHFFLHGSKGFLRRMANWFKRKKK